MQAKVNSGNPQTHAVFFLLRRCDVIFFHYIICGGKSLINNTRVKIRYFSSVFDITNQLLKRHTSGQISKYTGVMQNDCPVILHHVTQGDQYYCANINLSQRLKSKRNIERGKKKGQ